MKALDLSGLKALVSRIAHAQRTADAAAAALETLSRVKQDKLSAVSVTISKTGWASDSTAGYPCYFDIPAGTVSERDRAAVVLVPSSLAAALSCGLCPTCETLAGKIRIRAAKIPAAELSAVYWLEKGT